MGKEIWERHERSKTKKRLTAQHGPCVGRSRRLFVLSLVAEASRNDSGDLVPLCISALVLADRKKMGPGLAFATSLGRADRRAALYLAALAFRRRPQFSRDLSAFLPVRRSVRLPSMATPTSRRLWRGSEWAALHRIAEIAETSTGAATSVCLRSQVELASPTGGAGERGGHVLREDRSRSLTTRFHWLA